MWMLLFDIHWKIKSTSKNNDYIWFKLCWKILNKVHVTECTKVPWKEMLLPYFFLMQLYSKSYRLCLIRLNRWSIGTNFIRFPSLEVMNIINNISHTFYDALYVSVWLHWISREEVCLWLHDNFSPALSDIPSAHV
jgi:hypothetical protein